MAGWVCILNPHASSGKAARRWPAIARALEAAGIAYTARETAGPGDATRLAREALRSGATTIVAVGGDGTIHEVVNGFFDGEAPVAPAARLGILPIGSGSDLIKTLGIPADTVGAIERLMRNAPRAIDLGLARFTNHQGQPERRYYINSASAGMTGAVLRNMAGLPSFITGSAAYFAGTLMTMGNFRPYVCRLAIDDQPETEQRVLTVVVNNGRYFGGGMEALPTADVADGALDVLVLKDRSVPELLLNFPRLYMGTHLDSPIVEWVRARRVTMRGAPQLLELDGEQPGVTPATFEVVPGALQVLV